MEISNKVINNFLQEFLQEKRLLIYKGMSFYAIIIDTIDPLCVLKSGK